MRGDPSNKVEDHWPGYTEEEVGYNLSLVYGPEFSGTVVLQVLYPGIHIYVI